MPGDDAERDRLAEGPETENGERQFSSALHARRKLRKWFDGLLGTQVGVAQRDPRYLAPVGANGGFLLQHATGNHPKHSEIDAPLSYAGYSFLEALLRARQSAGASETTSH
jgi:hypothetical protein